MALQDALDRYKISYDPERVAILIEGLRRDPVYASHLREYASAQGQSGGAEIPIPIKMTEGDFLGSEARWFVDVMGSPYAQIAVRMLFTVLFFVSYVEKLPGIGSILSAVLDITLASGRILIKMVQKALPPVFGLLPLPYASMVGLSVASVFGLFLWPVLAIVSFSRQDFTSAIDSFIRIVPPPMGDALADAFLDANRTVYKLNENRKKLVEDIVSGLQVITDVGTKTVPKLTEGASTLQSTLKTLPPPPRGGRRDRLSRKRRFQTKWTTRRQRTKSVKHFGSGSR